MQLSFHGVSAPTHFLQLPLQRAHLYGELAGSLLADGQRRLGDLGSNDRLLALHLDGRHVLALGVHAGFDLGLGACQEGPLRRQRGFDVSTPGHQLR